MRFLRLSGYLSDKARAFLWSCIVLQQNLLSPGIIWKVRIKIYHDARSGSSPSMSICCHILLSTQVSVSSQGFGISNLQSQHCAYKCLSGMGLWKLKMDLVGVWMNFLAQEVYTELIVWWWPVHCNGHEHCCSYDWYHRLIRRRPVRLGYQLSLEMITIWNEINILYYYLEIKYSQRPADLIA